MVERKHVGYKYDFLKNGTEHFLQLHSVNWAMEILDTRRAILWRCDWMLEYEYYFTLPSSTE